MIVSPSFTAIRDGDSEAVALGALPRAPFPASAPRIVEARLATVTIRAPLVLTPIVARLAWVIAIDRATRFAPSCPPAASDNQVLIRCGLPNRYLVVVDAVQGTALEVWRRP